jgi:hypothetical protein
MVMKNNGTQQKMLCYTQNDGHQRLHHSGQDPVRHTRLMHGRALRRYQQSRVAIEQMHRRVELEAANVIRIDVSLLTGNLDEDISILNIVA